MPLTRRAALFLIALLFVAPAYARRRAANAPGGTMFAAWPLQSVELVEETRDLSPLRAIVGNASIVALGDATHGTHEFYAVKLRMIDYLVRELGYDVLSLEAPFAITERINVYVQGGPGDPRALLRELNTRLLYFFWDVEELLAVIEWARAYNAHRGDRPPLQIAGADIYDETGAAAMVVRYLETVDPFAAAHAWQEYACVREGRRDGECESAARNVRDALRARGEQSPAFTDAVHAADVVLQFFHLLTFEPREISMAANLLWIREHRSRARKVIHWGHQEHVGKLPSIFAQGRTMGTIVSEHLGSDYVAIGTLTGSGTFLQWEKSGTLWLESPRTFPAPPPGSYEAMFRARGHAAMLVMLRGRAGSASFRTGGTTSGWTTLTQSLPQKLDAVVYIDVTTPTRPLR
jgi:erythromycin esterase